MQKIPGKMHVSALIHHGNLPQHLRAAAVHTDGKNEAFRLAEKNEAGMLKRMNDDETRTLYSCPCGWYFVHHCGCACAGWGCGSRRARGCSVWDGLPGTGLCVGSRLLCRTCVVSGTLGVSQLLSPLLSSVLCASLLPCALLPSLLPRTRPPLSDREVALIPQGLKPSGTAEAVPFQNITRLRMLSRHPETVLRRQR